MVSRRGLTNSGDTSSYRKGSNRALSVGLQLEKLEQLLCETSRSYCENNVLVQQIRHQFIGLADRKRQSSKELSHNELGDIIDTLKEILNSSPSLPPSLVFHFHSTIGLLRQKRGETDTAAHSFMKALWIATSTHEPQYEEIGLTIYRLGVVRGRTANYSEAVTLLEKGLAIYDSGGLPDNHPYVVSASNELEMLRPKYEKEIWRRETSSGFATDQQKREAISQL